MPLYEYKCRGCGHEFETLVRTGSTPTCPSCGKTDLERLVSMFAPKSDSTHDKAMRAAKQRDAKSRDEKIRMDDEYRRNHAHDHD
jgi:putative FmdB family regulatory protein